MAYKAIMIFSYQKWPVVQLHEHNNWPTVNARRQQQQDDENVDEEAMLDDDCEGEVVESRIERFQKMRRHPCHHHPSHSSSSTLMNKMRFDGRTHRFFQGLSISFIGGFKPPSISREDLIKLVRKGMKILRVYLLDYVALSSRFRW